MGRTTWREPFDTDLQARSGLGYQLAEGIALLSRVDWQARGLHGLGRPENFHERQVGRWTSFFERVKTRDLEGMDVASAWPRDHHPVDYIPGIMPDDYQFPIDMISFRAPARLPTNILWS